MRRRLVLSHTRAGGGYPLSRTAGYCPLMQSRGCMDKVSRCYDWGVLVANSGEQPSPGLILFSAWHRGAITGSTQPCLFHCKTQVQFSRCKMQAQCGLEYYSVRPWSCCPFCVSKLKTPRSGEYCAPQSQVMVSLCRCKVAARH